MSEGFLCVCSCSTQPTWTGVDPSQHALHLGDGVFPAAGAGLHVRLQLVEPVVEVLVALERQLRLFFGHHQFLQVVLEDDHPDETETSFQYIVLLQHETEC